MNAGRVLVVTGPPAAGKTTVAHMLAERQSPRSVHLHADDFWRYIVSGYIEPWLAQSHDQNSVAMTAVCRLRLAPDQLIQSDG